MRETVIRILQDLRPEFDFSENVDFIHQGMLDSFDVITLVTTLDNEYGISIDGIDIVPENFSSINSIIELVKRNRKNHES
jgi:acyl carrier protein